MSTRSKKLLILAAVTSLMAISAMGCAPATTPEGKKAKKPTEKKDQRAGMDHTSKTPFPASTPSISQGKIVYDANCAKCHGVKGDGKGPGGVGLKEPPTNFTDKDFIQRHKPFDLFGSIGEGKRAMPAFKSSLSETDRWNVYYYIRLFATSDEEMAAGKVIYEKNCLQCHGPKGLGDGPKAAELKKKPFNWTDQERLARHSDNQFFDIITKGKDPMPAWEKKLTEEERRQVLAYERSFGYTK